ncbi:hypothetical protein C8N24_2215 [Solirubrobacter pauli]|uniref:Uncharacterized protein n=1 Tax=Solirubrobacter pauli TaxID=166793 RepID=A0A660LCR9_9ACTN|nr:hypothetical protein [Solirubrobacter pauli]RKQ92369.1 hypothetical protein C8N24_2215 [Solirubrobacter pauli]
MENPPIYRIEPGETGTPRVDRVERPRLLTPVEREEARRRREEKREQKRRAVPKTPPQGSGRGVDYSA